MESRWKQRLLYTCVSVLVLLSILDVCGVESRGFRSRWHRRHNPKTRYHSARHPTKIEAWDKFRPPFRRYLSELRCPRPTISCNMSSPYRTADGTCNNLKHPWWGSSDRILKRMLPHAYDMVTVHLSTPRLRGRDGHHLPSPRLVSRTIHGSDANRPVLKRFTNMHQTWGQFVDHDMDHTPKRDGMDGCCTKFNTNKLPVGKYDKDIEPCFPIPIPPKDRHFLTKTCMNFVRSVQAPASKTCPSVAWEQLNRVTAYIDASMVYGSDQKSHDELRTGVDGMLLTKEGGLLPNTTNAPCENALMGIEGEADFFCFKAGDVRVNEHPALSSLHVVFVRLHNVMVTQLKTLNTHWDDEKLFQETRKIVGAVVQIITYKEYLPILVGGSMMRKHNLHYDSQFTYDTHLDATVLNEFATAAFRYGHSQVPSTYTVGNESIPLKDMFNKPSFIQSHSNGLTQLLNGLVTDVSQKVDRFFSLEITDHMFEKKNESFSGLDLASINLQRGRDHGLPPYNDYREICGRPRIKQPRKPVSTRYTLGKLLSIYRHIDDVDLYTGSLSEIAVPGAMIGPTFMCILVRAFRAFKFGDRFWYQNPDSVTAFTPEQIVELQKTTLSSVLCQTSEVTEIQPNSFKTPSSSNPSTPCSQISMIDLTKWTESV